MSETLINPIWAKYRLYIISAGALIVLGVVLFGFQYCDNWSFNRGAEKDKQKIEDKKAEIAPLEAQRDALSGQIDQKKGELTILEQNATEAEKQRIQAETNSNQKLQEAANINNQNFNGTSYEAAQRARCSAGFTEACK